MDAALARKYSKFCLQPSRHAQPAIAYSCVPNYIVLLARSPHYRKWTRSSKFSCGVVCSCGMCTHTHTAMCTLYICSTLFWCAYFGAHIRCAYWTCYCSCDHTSERTRGLYCRIAYSCIVPTFAGCTPCLVHAWPSAGAMIRERTPPYYMSARVYHGGFYGVDHTCVGLCANQPAKKVWHRTIVFKRTIQRALRRFGLMILA
jgi:hypothetical protein